SVGHGEVRPERYVGTGNHRVADLESAGSDDAENPGHPEPEVLSAADGVAEDESCRSLVVIVVRPGSVLDGKPELHAEGRLRVQVAQSDVQVADRERRVARGAATALDESHRQERLELERGDDLEAKAHNGRDAVDVATTRVVEEPELAVRAPR